MKNKFNVKLIFENNIELNNSRNFIILNYFSNAIKCISFNLFLKTLIKLLLFLQEFYVYA